MFVVLYTNAAMKTTPSGSTAPSIGDGDCSLPTTVVQLGENETCGELNDEIPLIILDMDNTSTATNDNLADSREEELVQTILKQFLDQAQTAATTSREDITDSDLTEFEQAVLSKYMMEINQQEIPSKPVPVCHLTAIDQAQEKDPMKVINFSPGSEEVKLEKVSDYVDGLGNNEYGSTTGSSLDGNAGQIQIAVPKLEQSTQAVPPEGEETAGSQSSIAQTPKVPSNNNNHAIIKTDNRATITTPLANNSSSTTIDCTAMSSSTSATISPAVAIVTAISTTNNANAISSDPTQVNIKTDHSEQEQEQQRSQAMRRNFSVWVGVTSCVWGILIYLIKSYT